MLGENNSYPKHRHPTSKQADMLVYVGMPENLNAPCQCVIYPMLCSVADKMKQKNRSISTSRLTASSCPNEIARSRRRIVLNAWPLLTCYPKTKVPPGRLKVSWLFRHFRTVMFARLPVYICVFLNFLSSFFGWNCWALSPV